jgi:chromosome segregation ATPase
MTFFKNILSPFITIDEPEQEGSSPSTAVSATPIKPATPIQTRVKSASVDSEIQQKLLDEVNAATPAELRDYYELVQSMADLNMDEATQFKSAYAAFQKQSKKSVEALITATTKRAHALDQAISGFEAELQGAQGDIDQLRSKADSIQAKMEELSQQIGTLKQEQGDVLLQASQQEQSLKDQQATFMTTAETVKAQLAAESSKLTAYLQPATTARAPKTRGK